MGTLILLLLAGEIFFRPWGKIRRRVVGGMAWMTTVVAMCAAGIVALFAVLTLMHKVQHPSEQAPSVPEAFHANP